MRMNKVLCKDIFSSKKLQQFYSMAFPTSTSFTCRFPHLSVLLETVAREDRVGKPTCCHIMRTVCGLLQFVPTVQPFQFTFACGLPQYLSYFPRISIIFNFISFWGCLTQNRPKQWDVMLAFKNDKNVKILMSLERYEAIVFTLPGSNQARHVAFNFGFHNIEPGRATFPGVTEALHIAEKSGDWDLVRQQLSIAVYCVQSATRVLEPLSS